MRLTGVLPKIRRSIGRYLGGREPSRELALSALIDLVACSAIRAGSEDYARERGTRGAATLHKKHVQITGERIVLSFKGKGGHQVEKEVRSRRLASALSVLCALPGRRLFQYRGQNGSVCRVRRGDANEFLRELAGVPISLKDFRTLTASALALEKLATIDPATSERRRRRQIREAVQGAAQELANTPTVCRKSYVHETVVAAFENGKLKRVAKVLGKSRSQAKKEAALAQVLASVEA
jgi:DNA topoisomerase-1